MSKPYEKPDFTPTKELAEKIVNIGYTTTNYISDDSYRMIIMHKMYLRECENNLIDADLPYYKWAKEYAYISEHKLFNELRSLLYEALRLRKLDDLL